MKDPVQREEGNAVHIVMTSASSPRHLQMASDSFETRSSAWRSGTDASKGLKDRGIRPLDLRYWLAHHASGGLAKHKSLSETQQRSCKI